MNVSDAKSFNDAISSGNVLVDCWAPWCAPCRALMPHIDSISKDYPAVKVVKVNIDEVPEVSSLLGIRSIPTLIMFNDGQEIDRVYGADVTGVRNMVSKASSKV